MTQPADRDRAPAQRPFVGRVTGIILLVALTGLLLGLFVLGIEILLAAFGGVLLAVFLRAFTNLIKRHTSLPDGWALTLAVGTIVGLFALFVWLFAPRIGQQIDEMGEHLPQMTQEVEQALRQHAIGQWVLDRAQDGEAGGEMGGQISAAFSTLSRWSTYILTGLFVGLFGAANPALYTRGIIHLTPLRHRERMGEFLQEVGHTLRWWLIGQGLAMLVIGVSTTIILLIFGIPLAVLLGLIVGLLGFIPYLGPIIGAAPVALIAATEGLNTLVYVMIAYVIVQVLEGYIVTPLIQHRTVYLPPVFTIISQILLGVVLGALGFIFATPLAAVVLVTSRFYRTDILGDREAAA